MQKLEIIAIIILELVVIFAKDVRIVYINFNLIDFKFEIFFNVLLSNH
jgi:hypothetical protein